MSQKRKKGKKEGRREGEREEEGGRGKKKIRKKEKEEMFGPHNYNLIQESANYSWEPNPACFCAA